MKTAMLTPSERLRPRMGNTVIDWQNGTYVVRQSGVRMDPDVSPGERRFQDAFEIVVSWVAVLAVCAFAWWALIEGSKIVYSFAFSHPFWH